MDDSIQLLKVREVAKVLGVHENTVRNWQKAGRIKAAIVFPSRHHRYASDEVERVRQEMRISREEHVEQFDVVLVSAGSVLETFPTREEADEYAERFADAVYVRVRRSKPTKRELRRYV